MRLRSKFVLLAMAAAALFFGGLFGFIGPQRPGQAKRFVHPKLHVPKTIELGVQEIGDEVFAQFELVNLGERPLEIANIRSSCGWTGLEDHSEGRRRAITSMTVAPDQSKPVYIRVGAQGKVGDSMLSNISFTTNDPDAPNAVIQVLIAKLSGGVATFPRTVQLGRITCSNIEQQIVQVYDGGKKGRKIASVTSTRPDRFSARLLPPPEQSPIDEQFGRLIGQIEVQNTSGAHGSLDGEVLIKLDGENREPDIVPVTGCVVRTIEVYPPILTLNSRRPNNAPDVGVLLFENTLSQPIKVRSKTTTPYVSVIVRDAGAEATRQFVELRMAQSEKAVDDKHLRLDFEVYDGFGNSTISVEIIIKGTG